jgi:hypothetical protein
VPYCKSWALFVVSAFIQISWSLYMCSPRFYARSLSAFALMIPLLSSAQAVPPGPSSAAVSGAVDPSLTYRSAFDGYKAFDDGAVMSWKDANNLVRDTNTMAGHNMGEMKGEAGQGPATMAGHNMKDMPKSGTVVPAPATMMGMSGHAIGDMKPMDTPGAPKVTSLPGRAGAGQAPQPGRTGGHDMSGMAPGNMGTKTGASQSAVAKPKTTPAAKTDAPRQSPEMRGMTGHDMEAMGKSPPRTQKPAGPTDSGAAADRMPMMDHRNMKKQ